MSLKFCIEFTYTVILGTRKSDLRMVHNLFEKKI